MRIRWRNFELPSRVVPDPETLTPEFGRFVIEPFERGFGQTIGNGLRRVLLSSIEGTAITNVRVEGASHEFDSLEGVYEDVTDIILNLKRLRIHYEGVEPIRCRIKKDTKGEVTGADVQCEGGAEVVNTDLHIATLTMDREFEIELEVKKGRGYVPAEENALPPGDFWSLMLDDHSDYWDPPPPATGRPGSSVGFKMKGRFGDRYRNDLESMVGESHFHHFLYGRSITDQAFFEQQIGTVAGPFAGPMGYYLTRVMKRTPPTRPLNVQNEKHAELLRDDYIRHALIGYCEEALQQAKITGL